MAQSLSSLDWEGNGKKAKERQRKCLRTFRCCLLFVLLCRRQAAYANEREEREEGTTIVAVCFLLLLLFAVVAATVEIIHTHFKILFISENLT